MGGTFCVLQLCERSVRRGVQHHHQPCALTWAVVQYLAPAERDAVLAAHRAHEETLPPEGVEADACSIASLVHFVAAPSGPLQGHPAMQARMKRLRLLFTLADDEGHGAISAFDLDVCFRRCLGRRPSAYEKQRVWRDVDTDGDGYLHLPEFIRMMLSRKLPLLPELARSVDELVDLFQLVHIDEPEVEYITLEHFSAFLGGAGQAREPGIVEAAFFSLPVVAIDLFDEKDALKLQKLGFKDTQASQSSPSYCHSVCGTAVQVTGLTFRGFCYAFAECNSKHSDVRAMLMHKEQELQDLFALFDCDGSGGVDVDELSLVMRCLGKKPTRAEVQPLLHPLPHPAVLRWKSLSQEWTRRGSQCSH